ELDRWQRPARRIGRRHRFILQPYKYVGHTAVRTNNQRLILKPQIDRPLRPRTLLLTNATVGVAASHAPTDIERLPLRRCAGEQDATCETRRLGSCVTVYD